MVNVLKLLNEQAANRSSQVLKSSLLAEQIQRNTLTTVNC